MRPRPPDFAPPAPTVATAGASGRERINRRLARCRLTLARALRREERSLTVERILESNEARASRTRALIQLGGLVQKSGLPEVLRLPAGADLQRDHPNEAAIILGVLLDAAAELRKDDAETHRARLRALGAGTFKS